MQRINYAQQSPELLKRFAAFNNALKESTIEDSIRDLVTLRASHEEHCHEDPDGDRRHRRCARGLERSLAARQADDPKAVAKVIERAATHF